MSTDIDRLHAVADGRALGRGCGKSYLKCHQVAGLIETGSKFVAFIMSNERDLGHLIPMMAEVFHEHGLGFRRVTRFDIRSGDATIRMIVGHRTDAQGRLPGLPGAIIKDLRWTG